MHTPADMLLVTFLPLLLAKGGFSEEEKKLVSSAFGSIRKIPSSGPKKAKNEKEHLPRRSDDMGTQSYSQSPEKSAVCSCQDN